MNMTLPNVRVGQAKPMNLSKRVECEGNAEFQKEVPVYAPFEGKVLKAYVKVGDVVKKGDALYQLDIEEIEKALQTKQIELKKAEVSLKLQSNKVSSINDKLNKMGAEIQEEQEKQSLINEDKELEIKDAKELVAVNEELYKNSLLSENELRKSQIALESLLNEQKNDMKEKQEAKKEAIKNLEKEMESLQDQRKEMQGQGELQQIEIEQIKLEIAELEAKKGQAGIIKSSNEGKVLETKEGEIVGEGEKIGEGQVLLRLGSLNAGYKLEVEVDPKMDFMKLDDVTELKGEEVTNLQGSISKIKKEKDKLKVDITFNSEQVNAGDQITATFKEEEKIYDNVIPYSAVYKEGDGYFVFVAESIKDALGKSYVVKKKKVYVEDYDDTYAAISDGITVLDKVIITSEEEIAEGMRIRLENENEVLGDE